MIAYPDSSRAGVNKDYETAQSHLPVLVVFSIKVNLLSIFIAVTEDYEAKFVVEFGVVAGQPISDVNELIVHCYTVVPIIGC